MRCDEAPRADADGTRRERTRSQLQKQRRAEKKPPCVIFKFVFHNFDSRNRLPLSFAALRRVPGFDVWDLRAELSRQF